MRRCDEAMRVTATRPRRTPYGQRAHLRCARRPRCRGRLLAQLDAGEARRVARGPASRSGGWHVSLVWNAYLWSTGRRVTMRHVRQALIPGLFFGLNLAAFFSGATHNSVANAALHRFARPRSSSSRSARSCSGSATTRALSVFALVAFGGVALVLFSAPPNGDASLRGNVFGLLAMLLWTGYVVSTRHFRRDMDVATFMATVCPIAAVAVLPLADRPRWHVRHERHRLDLHADPHAAHRRCRPRSAGVRAEDDPDRHHRHRPGGAARPRGRLVVPAARRDAASMGRSSASPSSSAGCWRSPS